ncbi:pyrimidine 5'-nucleotidase [Pseudaeromonas paramecii]|uniref:Pyrimidine 5'-nucleotidase n=1 Tax=Pseudaeromonas paramecii TaxID=2138166 RepID=A0ABP8Q8J3_9GAMM
MAYRWILFDLDDTLFDFPAPRALETTLAHYEVQLTPELLADYQQLNQGLWQQFNAGQIDAKTLQFERFSQLAPLAGVTPWELNQRFFAAILDYSAPLDGVVSTLAQLQGKVGLGIVTNGFGDIQRARLAKSGLDGCFDFLLVSEELGVNKPDPRIFAIAGEQMANCPVGDVLMVGDNPLTDVAGAAAAGMETCWFDLHKQGHAVSATHIITDFAELLGLPRVAALLA